MERAHILSPAARRFRWGLAKALWAAGWPVRVSVSVSVWQQVVAGHSPLVQLARRHSPKAQFGPLAVVWPH